MPLHHALDRAGERLQLVDILGIAQDRRGQPLGLLAAVLCRLIEHVPDRRILEQARIHGGRDLHPMAPQRGSGCLDDRDGFSAELAHICTPLN